MKLDQAINIEDLQDANWYRRSSLTLSKAGSKTSAAIERNRAAFQKHQLLPRYLVDVPVRNQAATLFGHTYSSPFGISPTGGAGLTGATAICCWPRRRPSQHPLHHVGRQPCCLDGRADAGGAATPGIASTRQGRRLLNALIKVAPRLRGVDATGDRRRAIHPKRELLAVALPRVLWREMEALKLKPSILLEAITHPAWVIDYVRHGGASTLGNWAPHAGNGASKAGTISTERNPTPAAAQTWRDLERYRRLFPRPLVVKGILSPADAVRAAEIGVDGIIVSNHGGRQLDQAPASLDALPAIKAAVGDKVTVMLDSGVRRGADILIARCLGAQFVFFGRPTLYGAVAGGGPGVKKAVDIFRTEIDLVMAQIGCPSLAELGPDFLWRDDWTQNR